jgi:hypothetical protein
MAIHTKHRQRDPAVIRPNVDGGGRSGNDGATGAALHSAGSGVGPGSWSCVRWVGNPAGLWCSHRRRPGRAAPPVGGVVAWPVILRHLGRGHGRSPDHRPHGGCSALVSGGNPRIAARPPALWSWSNRDLSPRHSLWRKTTTPGDVYATWSVGMEIERTPIQRGRFRMTQSRSR